MASGGESSMETRTFPLADVLSITTPHLLSRRHIDGVIDLVNWMRGTDFVVVDGRFSAVSDGRKLTDEARVCSWELVDQHPWLADVYPPAGLDAPDLYAWLLHVEQERGENVEVRRG